MNKEQQQDEEVWRLAKARVDFNWNLMAYFVVNTYLIVLRVPCQ